MTADPPSPPDCTLAGARDFDAVVVDVYRELRALAHGLFARERKEHTMQATALVHEAFLRLRSCGATTLGDRSLFLRAAAIAMQRILIEHARRHGAVKRGSGAHPTSLDSVELASSGNLDQILAIDEALAKLAVEDPGLADLVRLRFYGGLDTDELMAALNRSRRSVMRDWAYARARLFELLQSG